MDIRGWDLRCRSSECASDLNWAPTPLLVETAEHLEPGVALDLACGTGRNSLWLAANGWRVTAVDGSSNAISILRDRLRELSLEVNARVADLQQEEFRIGVAAWDLIAICFYLQRNLFEPAKQGVKPGGLIVATPHLIETGQEPTASRLPPGELRTYFKGWEILHYHEGKSRDPAHHRPSAEIVARRPPGRPSWR